MTVDEVISFLQRGLPVLDIGGMGFNKEEMYRILTQIKANPAALTHVNFTGNDLPVAFIDQEKFMVREFCKSNNILEAKPASFAIRKFVKKMRLQQKNISRQ